MKNKSYILPPQRPHGPDDEFFPELDSVEIVAKKEEPIPEKTPPSKDDNVKKLRESRDALQKEVEELRKLKDLAPLSKVADYVKKKRGKDTIEDEDVEEAIIKPNRERKKKVAELEEEKTILGERVKHYSIQESPEYKEQYLIPIQKAYQSLVLTVVDPDAEGNARKPEIVDGFLKSLPAALEKDGSVNPPKLKALVNKFKKEYASATGNDDYDVSPMEVMKALESLNSASRKADSAKANWETEKQKIEQEKEFFSAQEAKRRQEQEINAQKYVFQEVVDSYDPKKTHWTEEEWKDGVKALRQEIEDVRLEKRQKRKAPEAYSLVVKAFAYDDLLEKYKAIESRLKKATGLPSDGNPPPDKKIAGLKEGEDPLAGF